MNIPHLTYNQWGRVISRFKSSTYRLELSGDYPENQEDKLILQQLIYFQFEEKDRKEEL